MYGDEKNSQIVLMLNKQVQLLMAETDVLDETADVQYPYLLIVQQLIRNLQQYFKSILSHQVFLV